ncbi:uncharacterized protein [Dendrobates tinctorius]|uniref:uncharacterized protein isoform X1 n=2 Tax=Dendrobates tinctorius TaxID=92724 RepID=UPI003CC9D5BF
MFGFNKDECWNSEYDSTWEDEEPPQKMPKPQHWHNFGNRSARDMQRYRHGYDDLDTAHDLDSPEEMMNLQFYQNQRAFQPHGQRIEDIHDRWWNDYQELEANHSYIQWLFPLREPGVNPYATPLTPEEIKRMRADEGVMWRLLQSYKMMLEFYGIQLLNEKTGEVSRATNWEERYHNLNRRSHNNLRITRILKCLGEMGYDHLQAPLVQFFLEETLCDKQLSNVKRSVLDYFMFTVKDKQQRRRLVHFAWENYKSQGPFIWGPVEILQNLTAKKEKENDVTREEMKRREELRNSGTEQLITEYSSSENEQQTTEDSSSESKRLITEDSSSESKRLITEDSSSESKRLITEDSSSESKRLITEDSSSESRRLITEDSSSESRRLITEDSSSESKRLITEDSSSESKRLITEDSSSQNNSLENDKITVGNSSGKDQLITQDNSSENELLIPEDDRLANKIPESSNSGNEVLVIEDNSLSHEKGITVLHSSGYEQMIAENNSSEKEPLVKEESSSRNEQVITESNRSGNENSITGNGSGNGQLIKKDNSSGSEQLITVDNSFNTEMPIKNDNSLTNEKPKTEDNSLRSERPITEANSMRREQVITEDNNSAKATERTSLINHKETLDGAKKLLAQGTREENEGLTTAETSDVNKNMTTLTTKHGAHQVEGTKNEEKETLMSHQDDRSGNKSFWDYFFSCGGLCWVTCYKSSKSP